MSAGNEPFFEHEPKDISRRLFLEISGGAFLAGAGLLTHVGRAYPAGTGRKLRIGVVGGNFGASWFWHEHPDCVVTGVTDLWPDRRERLRKTYRCDAVYDSLETMVKEAKDIDAVAIFSGAPDHVRHAKMSFERGWHAISAVPACVTLEEAEELRQAKQKAGLHYMMAETSWYRPEVIYARNFHRAGGFGELFYSEVEYYHDRGDLNKLLTDKRSRFYQPDGKRSWRWGFAPMHYPTHSLGCLVGVTGERITKVSCIGWSGSRPEVHDHPMVADNVYKNPFWSSASMMVTDQGHACRCNVFFRCVAGGERGQWFGDRASLYMPKEGLHQAVEAVRTKGAHPAPIPRYWQSDMLPESMRHESGHGGSHTFITAEFVNALLEDREPEVNLGHALAITVPGIVAQQSALRDGEQLTVPQFAATR